MFTYYEAKDCYREFLCEFKGFEFYWLPRVNGMMVKDTKTQTAYHLSSDGIDILEKAIEEYKAAKARIT